MALNFVVREATAHDLPLIRDLAAQLVVFSLPHHRQISQELAVARVRSELAGLEVAWQSDEDLSIFVASTTPVVDSQQDENSQLLGYVIVDFNDIEAVAGGQQARVIDIGVRPDSWEKGVGRALMQAAVSRAYQAGLSFISGEISGDNERCLEAAKAAGFVIERYQVSARIGPKGLV